MFQVKCYVQTAATLGKNELQEALDIIESTKLKYFTKEMTAEFYALKGKEGIIHKLRSFVDVPTTDLKLAYTQPLMYNFFLLTKKSLKSYKTCEKVL